MKCDLVLIRELAEKNTWQCSLCKREINLPKHIKSLYRACPIASDLPKADKIALAKARGCSCGGK